MEMEERTLQIRTIPTQAPVYLQATGLFSSPVRIGCHDAPFRTSQMEKAEAEGIQPWFPIAH